MIRTIFVRRSLLVTSTLLLISSAALSIPARAQARERGSAPARITESIDESSVVTLHGNTHPLAQPRYDRGPAPVSMPASRLLLVLQPSAEQEASLQTYLESLQDPNSPNYHKWLTPDEFGKQFGVSDTDLAAVQTWLQGHGFTINRVAKGRMAIEISGTVGQVQNAFGTSLHSYSVNGEQHWANASDPQIPSALAPVVAGFAELNNFVPKSQAIRGPRGEFNQATGRIEPSYTLGNSSNGYTMYLGPADAATIYNTPTIYNASHTSTTYDGTGVTIGIAGDSNIDVAQNANFRATFGLPANATTVVVDGADPGENGDALEAYLDTQVSGGIAPNANVVLYTAENTYYNAGLFLAIIRAIDDNKVDILNVSFGGCEAHQGASGNQYIYNLWQQAAAQGIAVTVSSGDSGSAGCDNPNTSLVANGGLAVNALASTPYNIAVGGTDFDTLYSAFPGSFTSYVDISNTLANHRSALKYIPERPWNDSTFQNDNTTISQNLPWNATQYASNANIVATGGGFSACAQQSSGVCSAGYPVPSWQTSFALNSAGRNVPDVSLFAGNGLYGAVWGLCTDLEYYSSGDPAPDCVGTPTTGTNFNLTGVGGTSAAAPAFAGILALVQQKAGTRLGQADWVLYNLAKSHYATAFHDIASGNNSVNCEYGSSGCTANARSYYFMTGYDTAVGYDEASGLGSVNASQLVNSWSSAGLTATTSSFTLNGGTSALNLTHGDSVSVHVGVTGSGGTPSGDVALVDDINPANFPNNDSIGLFSLASGTATGATSYLPGGSYHVTAHYGGNPTFAESNSNAIAVTVGAESSTTNLTVQGYYDPATGTRASTPNYGYIYLIDAQPYGSSASAASPNGAASGTITFKNGSTTLGTAQLASNGVAELQTSTIPAGTDSLTAVFPGDASFKASTSSPVSFAVQPSITSLMLAASSNFYNAGDPVPITATLGSSASANHLDSLGVAPTGTVTFQIDQGTTLGTSTVTGTPGTSSSFATGSSTFTATKLAWGGHTLTGNYGGDANYGTSSSSNNYSFIYINGATSNMTLVPASSTIKVNQSLPVTVTLAPSGTLPAPTGTVVFTARTMDYSPVYTSPAVTIANGAASTTIPANVLPLGAITVNAVSSGDTYYYGNSASAPVQVISSGTVAPTVTLILPTMPVITPYPVTVQVSGPAGDPVPTGSVMLTGNPFASYPLVNGSATISYSYAATAGPNTLTATYLGDSTYTSGTASGVVNLMASPGIGFTPAYPAIAVNLPLTMTVTVSTISPLPAPTGTLTISSGGYSSGPTQLVAGSATFTIPGDTLPIGSDPLTASYGGDTNYTAAGNTEYVLVTAAVPPGVSLTGTNLSVSAGATTGNTSTISVTPVAGFTGAVTLTAAVTGSPFGAIDAPTLSFGTTSPLSITDANAGTATLTVSTKAGSSSSCAASIHALPTAPWYAKGGAVLALVFLFGIPARRRKWRTILGMVALLALSGGIMACGGGGGSNACTVTTTPGTTAGTYTVTVTAASGSMTATTDVNVTVR